MRDVCVLVSVLLFTLVAGVFVGSSHGCASVKTGSSTQPTLQPVIVARDAHDVYDLIMSGLTTLRLQGFISDTQKQQIENVRVPVYNALVRMDDAALKKDPKEFYSARQAFDLALPSLRDWLISQQKKSTTQPVRITDAVRRDYHGNRAVCSRQRGESRGASCSSPGWRGGVYA